MNKENDTQGIQGYKIFKSDWTCNGFQYEIGKIFEEDVIPSCYGEGFHFCETLLDCFTYYPFNFENKIAKIVALGDIHKKSNDSHCATNKIKIVEEISWKDALNIANNGINNIGVGNIGRCNHGHKNIGNWNDGDKNIGSSNTGDMNNGSGNIGYLNSGGLNIGSGNLGDFNHTSFSCGCFNTKPSKIFLFNKISDWTYADWLNSRARSVLSSMPINTTSWVCSDKMTDEEKEENPLYKIYDGCLRNCKPSQKERQRWWNGLGINQKKIVAELPNFNKEIFKEITGIDIDLDFLKAEVEDGE